MKIDVHCHLNDPVLFDSAEEVVARATEAGVGRMIVAGYDDESNKRAKMLSDKFDGVYFCAGLHPENLNGFRAEEFENLKAYLSHPKCVALGEIGLDYHWQENPPAEVQKEYFEKQIALADEYGLPIVVHSRDALEDTLSVLEKNASLLKRGGVMHCYSYAKELLPRFLKLGLYFSFGGTCTFKNAKKVVGSVAETPFDKILTETDSPYLSPEPYRGERNEPVRIENILGKISEIKQISKEESEERIFANAKAVFPKLK